MKKKSRRMTAVMLAAILGVSSLTACGTKNEQEGNDNSEASDGKVTLTVWSLYGTNPEDKSAAAFQEAIKEIMEEDSSVEIKLDYAENEAYKTKIKAAVAANEAPDIYGTWGGGFTQPFVEADKVLRIDDYLTDEINSKLLPGVLDYYTYDGNVYGLPTKMSTCHLFVNKKIMDEHELNLPNTFDELVEVCKTLREAGITPISLGSKDRWAIGKVFDMMGVRACGIEEATKILSGEDSFNNPDFLYAAENFNQLAEAGAFTENAVALNNDEALADFTLGKAAMFYNGSWSCGFINSDTSQVKGDVVAIPFPEMKDGKGTVNEFVGGASDGFVINKDTKYPDKAFEVLQKISYKMSLKSYQNSLDMPVWDLGDEVDESKIDPLFAMIVEDASQSTGYMEWWDTFFEGSAAQDYLYALIDLSMGEVTPEEFCETMNGIVQ